MIEKHGLVAAIENLNHSVDSLSTTLINSSHLDEELRKDIWHLIQTMKSLTNDLEKGGNVEGGGI